MIDPRTNEIVREFSQAVDEGGPSSLGREKQDAVAYLLNEHVVSFKAEFARETHGLTASITKQFRGFHN